MKLLDLSLIIIVASAFFAGCGNGDFRVNSSAGTRSTLGGSGSGDTPQAFFEENIFPLLTSSGSKGCTGCHAAGATTFSGNEPYQVDATSASNSWNWASVRRVDPVTATDYSDAGDPTLKAQMEADHENFANWKQADRDLLNQWTNLN